MKKVLVFPLVAGLALALSITALADSAKQVTPTDLPTIPVTGSYQESAGGEIVYSLDIAWGDMNFVYTKENVGTWDPNTHTYTGGGNSTWSYTPAGANGELAGNVIQVTNHSNIAVTCSMDFAVARELETVVRGGFNKSSINLGSAEGKGVNDESLSDYMELNILGELPEDYINYASIGYVRLTVQ